MVAKKLIKEIGIGGLQLTGGSLTIGALPSTPETTPIKTNVQSGLVKFSQGFPTVAKLGSTAFILQQIRKLDKSIKKLERRK